MGKTAIEWADVVWNPVTGCTKVSQGCKNCYAKALHDMRYKAYLEGKKVPKCYWQPFEQVQTQPGRLEDPLHWKKPRRVFVNSMSDLFHRSIPQVFLFRIFAVMALSKVHTFMILTKRPAEMLEFLKDPETPIYLENWTEEICGDHGWCPPDFDWPLSNVWLGVSVEDQKAADERIPMLLQTPTAVRFVSCEPLLGLGNLEPFLQYPPFHDNYKMTWGLTEWRGLDWVIVGGESGPGARPMHPIWARSLRDQCQAAGVPFFFKQWGEWTAEFPQGKDLSNTQETYEYGTSFYRLGKKANGRKLDGLEWNEFPGG